MKNLAVDLGAIPKGWWLYGLFHNHTPVRFAGEIHVPFEKAGHGDDWTCKLQHVNGGLLTQGDGRTPAQALTDAIQQIELAINAGRYPAKAMETSHEL